MPDALSTLLRQILDKRSIQDAAIACRLPYHRLADIVYGRTLRPKPEVLQAISDGLGVSYKTLALAAYGVIAPEEEGHGDDNEGREWSLQPAEGKRPKAATEAT